MSIATNHHLESTTPLHIRTQTALQPRQNPNPIMNIIALVLRALQVRSTPLPSTLTPNNPLIHTLEQLLFGAVILGLSITLIKGQYFGSAPSQTDFSAFAGGWALLAALVGILATTVFGALEGIPILVLDALATLFLLAAGIVRHPSTPLLSTR